MAVSSYACVDDVLSARRADDPQYAVVVTEALLRSAVQAGASDVHFVPGADELAIFWRIDGVLQRVGRTPQSVAANVVARLKVLARLLTYQTAMPQEGRIVADDFPCEVRVSTFPTVFGEKAVARILSNEAGDFARIASLRLPDDVCRSLYKALAQTSGAVLIVGPAGSGKTTTAYACLREVVAATGGARSIASLEDPVEVIVPGVSQSQVQESAGFDLLSGLRSLVRQDPEVIFFGEIRDPPSATAALQAALTGQLLITTFHAGDAAGALSRLADMGIPAYVLRSALNCVIAQRLLRRLCRCAEPRRESNDVDALGIDLSQFHVPVGCEACHGTGYSGRAAVAEVLSIGSAATAAAVLEEGDAQEIAAAARESGMKPLFPRAVELVEQGVTSPAEVRRVFGTIT